MNRLLKNKIFVAISVITLVAVVAIVVNIIIVSLTYTDTSEVPGKTNSGLKYNGVYAISNSPTAYQKELYNELNDVLKKYQNGDKSVEKELVQLVVQNFVADFYTWTNKSSSYDVGGLMYIAPDSFLSAETWARETFYSDLDAFVAQIGRENLIQVNNIEVVADYAKPFTFNFQDYDAYYVEARWTYESNNELKVSEFQNAAAFNVINYNDNWYIAQLWNLGE